MSKRQKGLTPEEIRVIWEELPSDVETSEYSSSSDESVSAQPQASTSRIDSSTLFSKKTHSISSSSEDGDSNGDDSCNDDSSDEAIIGRCWKKRDTSTTIPIFTLQKGVNDMFFSNKNLPTEHFLTFLDDDIIKHIIYQSNLYSNQKQRKIKPITKEEFYGFLGLNMLFSYHRLPRIRNYWSSDNDYSTPIVRNCMSRNRFFEILQNLHINDNDAMPNTPDKLFKLRPFIEHMNRSFQKYKQPEQIQSIDESMILFKGRSCLKQYNPMKPIKRGYKLWCRSDMSGYMYEFDVYQGKEQSKDRKFGLGENIVRKLTESLKNKNHIIMMDNFFSSIELFEYLKSVGISACGTVRSNRKGLPILSQDKTLKRGEFDFRSTDQGISYFKWRDNRSVFFLSNYHGTETCTVQRTQKDGSKLDVTAPVVVRDYNSHMGGVDKSDMLKALYDRNRKSKKWWHQIFFGILDITLVNSYIVYCELVEKLPLLEYKRRVTQGLITLSSTIPKKRGRPSSSIELSDVPSAPKHRGKTFSVPDDVRKQNKGAHWPVFVKSRGRCELCSSKKIESRPHSQCSLCKIFLCVNEKKNCFYDFHN